MDSLKEKVKHREMSPKEALALLRERIGVDVANGSPTGRWLITKAKTGLDTKTNKKVKNKRAKSDTKGGTP